MTVLFSNNASATIASSITASATTIVLSAGGGANFPSPGTSDWFYATLVDNSNNLEIVKCTSRNGDTLTVIRGRDGTTSRAYAAGSVIECRVVAAAFADFQSIIVPNDLPAGTSLAWNSATPPSGYLEENGALISRATYANLFAAIGTSFGAGDGSTTFALPDKRGYFLRGWDHSRGIDSGRTLGSTQADLFASHNHNTSPYFGAINFSRGAWDPNGLAFMTSEAGGGPGYDSYTGGAETRPKNIAVMFVIKY